jgi:hypothetical protein
MISRKALEAARDAAQVYPEYSAAFYAVDLDGEKERSLDDLARVLYTKSTSVYC